MVLLTIDDLLANNTTDPPLLLATCDFCHLLPIYGYY
jgi:hypothetical protein